MPDHLPLEAWDRRELLHKLWNAQGTQRKIEKELDRRGQRDEWKWGFPVHVYERLPKSGALALTGGYHVFDTAGEAYDGARKYARENGQDEETAPYQVHKVWLPASADTLPKGQDAKQGLAGTESGAVPAASPTTDAHTAPDTSHKRMGE